MATRVPAHSWFGPRGAPRLAFVLHGILGRGRNWSQVARALSARHSDWALLLIDLRNHAASRHATPPHTLAACAADLRALEHHLHRRASAVIGHSFGGKVALTFAAVAAPSTTIWALDSPPGPVAQPGPTLGLLGTSGETASGSGKQMPVISSTSANPGARPGTKPGERHRPDILGHHPCPEPSPSPTDEVSRVLDLIRGLPQPLQERSLVVNAALSRGLSAPVARWLASNLRRGADGLRWHFDLAAIDAMLADYRRANLWPVVERPADGTTVHLVRGALSDRWSAPDRARFAHLQATGRAHTLAGAGHWLHADAPEALGLLLAKTFGRSEARRGTPP